MVSAMAIAYEAYEAFHEAFNRVTGGQIISVYHETVDTVENHGYPSRTRQAVNALYRTLVNYRVDLMHRSDSLHQSGSMHRLGSMHRSGSLHRVGSIPALPRSPHHVASALSPHELAPTPSSRFLRREIYPQDFIDAINLARDCMSHGWTTCMLNALDCAVKILKILENYFLSSVFEVGIIGYTVAAHVHARRAIRSIPTSQEMRHAIVGIHDTRSGERAYVNVTDLSDGSVTEDSPEASQRPVELLKTTQLEYLFRATGKLGLVVRPETP